MIRKRRLAIAAAAALASGVAGTMLTTSRPQPSGCVCAPSDGGTACLRVEPNGAARYFGADNAFPAAEGIGACEPCACSEPFRGSR